ncbi:MAG: AsmA family protein [Gammaproteobacteria bacterium]|nr:AsmA family protein [Gammaproteobacteria bacterium]
MSKILRVFGILVALLAVIIVVAALVLPRVIDPNNYRDDIARLVKEKTGRDLTIAGGIGWSVFPWLGVEIGAVRLSNAKGFGEEPFALVDAAQVRVKVLPLLRKEIEMSTVVLDGLQLRLARDKSGRTNWDDLMKPAAAKPARPEKPAERDGGLPVAALAIGGVAINDARVLWEDQATGVTQRIEDLDLELGAIEPGRPVDVTLSLSHRGGKPELASQVKLSAVVALAESLKQVTVSDLKLDVDAQGESLPGGRVRADLGAQAALDLDKQTLSLTDLVVNAMGLSLRGQAQGTGIGGDKPQLAGTLKIDEFVPRDVLRTLGQKLPEVSDATVLGKADAAFAFKATADSANLSDLRLRLDDSSVTGSLGISNFAKPATTFNLALDAIDLDRYLPPQKPGEVKAAPTPAEAAAGAAGMLPVDTLRGLNLKGTLKIGKLKAYQMRSTDITVTVAAKDGLVRVHPAGAKMYEGSYSGNVTLDVRGKEPRIAMDEKLAGVQIGPMLTDMTGDARITGKADIAVKLNAAGNDPEAMRRTMNGNASFSFLDGTVKGMNVLGEIRRAYALVRGKPAPAATGTPDQTDFSALTGTAVITNGLVRNDDLLLKSPVMQLAGKGTANLVNEQLDYGVTANLVDVLEGEGELTGRAIPVRITGTFSAPKVGVDMEQVLKQEVKKQIEKKIEEKLGIGGEAQKEEVQKDVQQKLEEKVQDKLKGLFGR